MKPTKPAASVPAAKKEPEVAVVPWGQVGVTGFENVKAEDLGVPFLAICQKGNPEFDATHPQHTTKKIDGILPGAVFNTVSREVVYLPGQKPILVTPIFWDKYFVEWRPRTTAGGGIVRAHKDPALITTCRRNEKNQDVLPNGNILVTTAYFYVAVYDDADLSSYQQRVIGMSSTQLKKSRTWLNMAQAIKLKLADGRMITPPLFSHVYAISSQAETNDKGSWFGWKIENPRVINDAALIDELVELNQKLRTSLVPDVTAAHDTGDEVA
jgi:hypothetical protein